TPNTITVNVTPVNDAPAGANKTVSTSEDTAYAFTAADFRSEERRVGKDNAVLGGQSNTQKEAREPTGNQSGGGAGDSASEGGRNQCGFVEFHAGSQRHWQRLRQLHLRGRGR